MNEIPIKFGDLLKITSCEGERAFAIISVINRPNNTAVIEILENSKEIEISTVIKIRGPYAENYASLPSIDPQTGNSFERIDSLP